MWLTRISIQNPYFTTMIMLLLIVLGLFSMNKLPVEQFPEVRFPIVVVSTSYSGASPNVVETEITRPMEEAVNTIANIKTIRSYSFEGSSVVIIEFNLSADPVKVLNDVREKVSGIQGRFRREISSPSVSQMDPMDQPILSLLISAPDHIPARELSTWADQKLRVALQTIDGVGELSLVGKVKRQIRVEIDPDRLDAYAMNIQTLTSAISGANQTFSAGKVSQQAQELHVRLEGKLRTPEAFAKLPVRWDANSLVRLEDIATVSDGEEEYASMALVNGQRALSLEIKATRGANVVALADNVHAKLDEIRKQIPDQYQITILNDTSQEIRRSLETVRTTLIEGAVLTVLIVFLFLNSWRSTVITGLTLPIALIGTLFAISVAGFTLNVMTLLALTLSIGLLIDDAIVVRENIMRHARFGKSHYQAAMDGTDEIGLAVLATTFTVVAVFFPVGFMDGMIGKFFLQFGLTVVVAVLISLLVSFSLDPMLSSVWHDPPPTDAQKKRLMWRFLLAFDEKMERLSEQYSVAIAWVLAHRMKTLVAASVLFVGSFFLLPWIGAEFLPSSDNGRFRVSFKTGVGAPIEYAEAKAREVEAVIRRVNPDVSLVYANIGGGFAGNQNTATLEVKIPPEHVKTYAMPELFASLREQLSTIAGIEIQSIDTTGNPGGDQKPINIGVRGNDFAVLDQIAKDLIQKISHIEGTSDLQSSLEDESPAIAIEFNREAAASLNVPLESLGSSISMLLAGNTATTWEAPDGENYDVVVQAPKSLRTHALMERVMISGSGQERIPLSSVASLRESGVPNQIHRVNQQREVTITGNIDISDANKVHSQIGELLANYTLPTGYSFEQAGDHQDMQESFSYAMQALSMGIIFIYMILASQFRSFIQPIAIMMSLPLALIGVFVALFLWGSTLNMFSIIGMIMLMGLVAKNGILLIDFVNHARREGKNRHDALCEAGRVRLRPILMTSMAMIFGMLPLALSTAEGSELNAPMAQAVIGGMITSTLLTLFIVPVVYSYLDSLGETIKIWVKKL